MGPAQLWVFETDPEDGGSGYEPGTDAVVDLLDLEQIEVNIFRGLSAPDEPCSGCSGARSRAQALIAAGRTVPERPAGALAARLLPAAGRPVHPDRLPGRPGPGRAVVHHPPGRRGAARQDDLQPRPASFQIDEPGVDHQADRCRRSPDPESLPVTGDAEARRSGPFDSRSRCPRPDRPPLRRRPAVAPAPGDTAVAAHSSGVDPRGRGAAGRPAAARLRPHVRERHDPAGRRCRGPAPVVGRRRNVMAPLDHAMWFHRPFRADGGSCCTTRSLPIATGGRGLAGGRSLRPGRAPARLGRAGRAVQDHETGRKSAGRKRVARRGCYEASPMSASSTLS